MSDLEFLKNSPSQKLHLPQEILIDYYLQTERWASMEPSNQVNTTLMNQVGRTCLGDLHIISPPDDRIPIEQTKGGLLMDAYD